MWGLQDVGIGSESVHYTCTHMVSTQMYCYTDEHMVEFLDWYRVHGAAISMRCVFCMLDSATAVKQKAFLCEEH